MELDNAPGYPLHLLLKLLVPIIGPGRLEGGLHDCGRSAKIPKVHGMDRDVKQVIRQQRPLGDKILVLVAVKVRWNDSPGELVNIKVITENNMNKSIDTSVKVILRNMLNSLLNSIAILLC